MLRADDYWYEILARNAAFVRFPIHFTTARYFWSNWAYQWNSLAVRDSRGMALTVSMEWRVSVFSWLYFYKAQRKKTRGEISNVFVDMSSILDPSDPYDEENLVWEKPPTVKSTPTTGPPKGKHLRAVAPQHSKQYCCLNVEKCILMFGKPLMSNFFLDMKNSNNNIILLILDGLDESPSDKLSIFLN